MSKPPGVAGFDGPILHRIRAITTGRIGTARLGVARLGFASVDVEVSGGNVFVEGWRADPEPGTYGAAYAGTPKVDP